MTPEDRTALADQLQANPLWDVLHQELEARAIERMVSARTDDERLEAQVYVRATREFRADCERLVRNNQPKKPAPV